MVAPIERYRIQPPTWPRVPVRDDVDPVPPFTSADTAWVFFIGLVLAWCGMWLGFGAHAGWVALGWLMGW